MKHKRNRKIERYNPNKIYYTSYQLYLHRKWRRRMMKRVALVLFFLGFIAIVFVLPLLYLVPYWMENGL